MNQNPEEILLALNEKRFVSQTTHFICAKCGGNTPISNRYRLPLKAEKETGNLIRLHFPCPKCNEEYDLGLVTLT